MWNYLFKLYKASFLDLVWTQNCGLPSHHVPQAFSLSHCGGFARLFSLLGTHLAPEAVSNPFVLPGTVEASPPANSS